MQRMVVSVWGRLEWGGHDDGSKQSEARARSCNGIRCIRLMRLRSRVQQVVVPAAMDWTWQGCGLWDNSQGANPHSDSCSSVGQELAWQDSTGQV